MHYLTVMLQLWALLLLCTVVGRRVTSWLPAEVQNILGFYLVPISGLASLIVLVSFYGYFAAFNFAAIILATAILTISSLIWEQKPGQLLKDFWQVAVFSSIASLPILAPIIRFQGYNPFTDIFTYLAQGQWLQQHAFSEKVITSGFYPYLTQIGVYQHSGSRMGSSFLLAYVQALFNLKWSYYAYIPTISLAFVSGCLAIGGIIRQVVAAPKIIILALALIPCVAMSGFVFGAEWGFFPQTFGLAFAAGVAALIPAITHDIGRLGQGPTKSPYSWPRICLYVMPAAVCTAALLYAYNEPFLIFAAALGLFFIVTLAIHKQVKSLLVLGFLYTVEVLVLLNYEIIRIAKNLIQTISISKGADIGWPVLWNPIQFLAHAFGLKSPFSNGVYYIDYVVSTFIFPCFFIVLAVILWRLFRTKTYNNLSIIFLLCVNFVLFLCFLKFRYFTGNATPLEMGYTFLQFKIAKYAAPFSLALIGISIAFLWQEYKKFRVFFLCCYPLALSGGLFTHYTLITTSFNHHFLEEVQKNKNPFTALLQLRHTLASIPKDQVIYLGLGAQHHKLRQMVAYILYDRKIASDYSDDGYILGHLPPADRVMPLEKAHWLLSMSTKDNTCDNINKLIGPFALQQAPFKIINLQKQEGGYATEFNLKGAAWNWVSNNINYHYQVMGSDAVKFAFNLANIPHPRKVTVDIKDQFGAVLQSYHLPKHQGEQLFETPWIRTNAPQLILSVKANGKPIRLSKSDSRQAKFIISNVRACVTPKSSS